jgi:hypothetical protein
MATEWELKHATVCAVQLIRELEKVGTGLYTLAGLLQCRAKTGQGLDEAETRGLAAIADALHDKIAHEECDYRDEILMLENFSQPPW